MRDKATVAIHTLNDDIEGGLTCDQYTFNGKQWSPCLEVESIQSKETLSNNLN